MAMEKESFDLLYFFGEKKKGKHLSLFLPGNRSIDGMRSIGPDRYLRSGRKDRFEETCIHHSLQNIAHNAANNNTITTMKHNSAFLKAYMYYDTPFYKGVLHKVRTDIAMRILGSLDFLLHFFCIFLSCQWISLSKKLKIFEKSKDPKIQKELFGMEEFEICRRIKWGELEDPRIQRSTLIQGYKNPITQTFQGTLTERES